MRSRKILLAIVILLVAIAVVIGTLSVHNIDVPQDGPVITYKIGHKSPYFEVYREVKMDIGGMHIGGIAILTVIGSLIGYFAILFWMFITWRVLLVLEKLSNTCDRLMQQKISNQQDRET